MKTPPPFRVERHELGPRCYIFGQRVHEVALGIALLIAALALILTHRHLPHHLSFLILCAGVWLTAKDWPDLFPGMRNKRAWRPLMHREADLTYRPAKWLPPVSGALAAFVGLLNIGAVLSPGLSDSAYDLTHIGQGQLVFYAHALVLPAGVGLLIMSYYLAQRRQRAWVLGLGLLATLVVLNLIKGELEHTAIAAALSALLVWGRRAFCVKHEQRRMTVAVAQASALLAGTFLIVLGASVGGVHWAHHQLTFRLAVREAWALFSLSHPPVHFAHALRFMALGARALSVGALLGGAWVMFRPLAHRRALPGAGVRSLAAELVRSHGTDTLSFFKLRSDQHYFFSEDRRAFLSYRVEAGVLLIAGDPVGPHEQLGALLTNLASFADARGLKLGCVGASEALAVLARQAGLRSFYLGDEAIVDVGSFSLEGRPIRKVRQSVTRLRKAGYATRARELSELSEQELSELERVSAEWRAGRPERGFSMALDTLKGEHLHDSLVVLARDGDGRIRGFLHFVPCCGRRAMSLSFMRRERDTPNGLTEFLVCAAIEAMRERGMEEMSLNFAAFGRWLRDPSGRAERVMGALMRKLDGHFQIESLYRFNAKFFPRWQPRYLLYESLLDLPQTALAAMWVEGQMPKPSVPALSRWRARHARPVEDEPVLSHAS